MGDSIPNISSSLLQALQDYESTLKELKTSSSQVDLLSVLIARDQVQETIKEIETRSTDAVRQVIELDKSLVDIIIKSKFIHLLPTYRKAVLPSESQWWWYLDQEVVAQEKKKDLIWNLVSVFLFTITGAYTLEIIKRFLIGSTDEISFLGTLLMLVLTSSSFTAQGREVWQWILEKILKLRRQYHAEANCIIAVMTALFVLCVWIFGIPGLAKLYNNRAVKKIEKKDLNKAVLDYQRASALANDAPASYNIGRLYEEIGQIDKATKWYQQALERDMDFTEPYNALGRMFILQKNYESAIWTLSAGLKRVPEVREDANELRYRLLQTIGWAYYANEEYELAQEKLEAAIKLEKEKNVGINSPVHYFLANIYEKKKMVEPACEHWSKSLRFPDDNFLYQAGWKTTIMEHILNCNKGDKQ